MCAYTQTFSPRAPRQIKLTRDTVAGLKMEAKIKERISFVPIQIQRSTRECALAGTGAVMRFCKLLSRYESERRGLEGSIT